MPSSCCQITRSIGVAPRPPYSFGQCRQAQPAAAFFFCQALPTSTISSLASRMRPSEAFDSSASYCFGALASTQFRASARKAASCGVSSKFICAILSIRRPREGGDPYAQDFQVERAAATVVREPRARWLWVPAFAATTGRGCCRREASPPPLGRYLAERHGLVHPDIAGQAEHALGDDVAHDLVGAALDAGPGRTQHLGLEFSHRLRV